MKYNFLILQQPNKSNSRTVLSGLFRVIPKDGINYTA